MAERIGDSFAVTVFVDDPVVGEFYFVSILFLFATL